MGKWLHMWAISMIALFSLLINPAHAGSYGSWGIDLEGMDRSTKPGDDFFAYVNGAWAHHTQIPPDKTSIGSFQILSDLSEVRVRTIIEAWADDKNLKSGSNQAKIASIYRSFLDEEKIEMLDYKPIDLYLEAIKKVQSHEGLASIMASSLYSFGPSFFALGVAPDLKDPSVNILYLSQAGLGLPDRDYYLQDNFKEARERYEQYVGDMLELIGWDDPKMNAAQIVAMQTKIAEAHWTRADSRSRDKVYNPTTIDEIKQIAPMFPWEIFFEKAGLGDIKRAIIKQNTAFPKLATIFGDTTVSTLKAWAAFHVIDETAPLLSSRFVRAQWEFRSHFLNGAVENRPRWKRAIEIAERLMGEAIGKSYVEQYFPPDSKIKMQALVQNLLVAFKSRIENLQWMSQVTKANALEKLTKFNVKIGYPSKWLDYSTLDINEGDVTGNLARAARFEWEREIGRIGREVDKEEWGMTPQTVNAYYSASHNEIVFPAAILQPPFFDPQADAAVNYGGIGAVTGHEITHGFDDQGRKSDGSGVLRDWWTPEDVLKFDAQASRLGAQYEALSIPELPNTHINPRLTMGENIGDLGGILVGLDAYRLSLHGEPAPILDGFNGDQRVFLGWAQVWRTLMRPEKKRQLLVSDTHSPGEVRAYATLRNVDAWYEAFDVKENDANFIKSEERVRIW